MVLSDLPMDLNPRGFHVHPSWLESEHWPTFKEVLNEWCGPIVPDLEKALADGQIPCILGVNKKRFRRLRELAGKTKCHMAGYLVLLPCDLVEESDEQAIDGTGAPASVSGTSGDDGSKGDQLD